MAARRESGAKLTTSLVVGLLLVPVSAVAAFGLVSRQGEAGSTTISSSAPVAAVPTTAAAADVVIDPVVATGDHLAAACGEDGLGLVALEVSGEITEVQQAALEALRQICSDAGLALPAPPLPPPVIRTVTVATPTTTTSSTAPTVAEDGDDDDDEQREHDDDDHDHDDHGDHEDDD